MELSSPRAENARAVTGRRRPGIWSLAKTEIKDLSLVCTKGAIFFIRRGRRSRQHGGK